MTLRKDWSLLENWKKTKQMPTEKTSSWFTDENASK